MPAIHPICAITYRPPDHGDVSALIAPPYDVLDETAKSRLLDVDSHNIVAIDLPHLPPKTVGSNAIYERAGRTYRQWLEDGVLERRHGPALFIYRQSFVAADMPARTWERLGLMAAVAARPFGRSPDGLGGIYPHEQTFGAPKKDRLKLMRATRAQLSPIFGLYSDPALEVRNLISASTARAADFYGTTAADGVMHEIWATTDETDIDHLCTILSTKDIFIADGHHRYATALNYKEAGVELTDDPLHPANFCMFVLIAMQDPAMRVLPTHRVLGDMREFRFEQFVEGSKGLLDIKPFGPSGAGAKRVTDLTELEKALPANGPHAIGIYNPNTEYPGPPLSIMTPCSPDPLARDFPHRSAAWRHLGVAIVQHLIVEKICQPRFCPLSAPPRQIRWHFPHSLQELVDLAGGRDNQLGLILQPTPLESIRQVSEAGELMPQKSTFFYPKLATGLVIHPLEPLT